MLAQALDQHGGPLTDKERKWADAVLQAKPKRKRRRRAA
jgi:hypothetical protein